MTRRTAVEILALLSGLNPDRAAAQSTPGGAVSRFRLNPRNEEVVEIDLGAGAHTVSTIRLVHGAVSVDIKVADLLAALK